MPSAERSVLHVLPHPGGGGERYVDLLSAMPGYRFSRVYLAPSARGTARVLPGLLRALRKGRRHDLVHVHGEVAGGLCLPLLATRPSVVTLHGLHLIRRVEGLARRATVLNLRAIVRTADRTICVSNAERDYLTSGIGPVAERVLVVHNGVGIPRGSGSERAAVRNELGIAESVPLGIWVGALDEHKDPLTAVRAAVEAGVALLVVGDGPLRSHVEQVAREPVRVLGRRRDVARLLVAADFFVLTSRREGLAFALLEAMSYQRPGVVSDTAENMEAIGDAGFGVPAADPKALTQALLRMARNEQERTALGVRARQRVADLFDAEAMLTRTRAVYDDVLACRRAQR